MRETRIYPFENPGLYNQDAASQTVGLHSSLLIWQRSPTTGPRTGTGLWKICYWAVDRRIKTFFSPILSICYARDRHRSPPQASEELVCMIPVRGAKILGIIVIWQILLQGTSHVQKNKLNLKN